MWLPTHPRNPTANTAAAPSEDGTLQRTRRFGGFFVLNTSLCLTPSGLARKNAPGVFVSCHPLRPPLRAVGGADVKNHSRRFFVAAINAYSGTA